MDPLINRKSVLVVEDDKDMNCILCDALEQAGYDAYPAFTGREALEQLENMAPDVVVLDLMLPDADGADVCRILNTPVGRNVVIVVSARNDSASKLASYISGARRYVTKPFDVEDLIATIENELRQRQLTRLQHEDETF